MAGPSPCGRTNVRIKGWMGRADQAAKVRGMFIHPRQIAVHIDLGLVGQPAVVVAGASTITGPGPPHKSIRPTLATTSARRCVRVWSWF